MIVFYTIVLYIDVKQTVDFTNNHIDKNTYKNNGCQFDNSAVR